MSAKSTPSSQPAPKRVLIVANWDWVLYNFRLPLARQLEGLGLEVILVCPPGQYSEQIRAQGFELIDWGLNRQSKNPFLELAAIFRLIGLYRKLRPDVVHHFTIKPIVYGSMAAKVCGVPVAINNFTGLGYLFSEDLRARLLKLLVLPMLDLMMRTKGIHTVFQNRDDLARFSAARGRPLKTERVIEGTGVDTEKFHPTQAKAEPPVVLMAARLLYDKGVREFVEAADQMAEGGQAAQFWLAGSPDPANPSSIPEDVIANWKARGRVQFLGHRSDMVDLLQKASIAALPSYHEGVPLFLLEAAASGLPLVGTDIEGCRLVIEDGDNGFLVARGETQPLAQALGKLLADPALRQAMGQRSRTVVMERFSKEIVLEKYRRLYRDLGVLAERGE